MAKVAVLGYGTVGSGVVEVLNTNKDLITERSLEEITVRYVLDLKEFPGTTVEKLIVHDFEQIVNDEEVDVVVEVMGGIEPANTFVRRSLEAGKSVVTSNKALVAKHGAELLKTAKEHQVNFLFEASVGGGIPIIRSLNNALTGDEIEEITGILNGTTNYMMTKMFYDGADYNEVLKEAQDNGYAERNPEADVEGYDACRKIAILSSIISGEYVDFEAYHLFYFLKPLNQPRNNSSRTLPLRATRHGKLFMIDCDERINPLGWVVLVFPTRELIYCTQESGERGL